MSVEVATKTIQVECVTKPDRYSPYRHITHIGGTAGGGWRITEEEAIAFIEAREWKFFVSAKGRTVWVVIAVSGYGNKYLKTQPDGIIADNLLSLPECPKGAR